MDLQNNVGISGEFRLIVKGVDGSIRLDTGMQPNLITDNGLRFFLGDSNSVKNSKEVVVNSYEHGGDAFNYCLLGTGNKTPEVSDLSLQNLVAYSNNIKSTASYDEEPDTGKHENYYRYTDEKVYVFNNINNENITEIGLASYYQDSSKTYTLITRSLIKNSLGSPISVTVLPGEILEVIYRINLYFDIRQKSGEFTLTNGSENKNFEYILQPFRLSSRGSVSNPINFNISYQRFVSYGVKEEDSLDSSYNLKTTFAGLSYKDNSLISQKTNNSSKTTSVSSPPTSVSYAGVVTDTNVGNLTKNVTIKNGIYTHIHDNGIRAFIFYFGYSSQSILSGIVVVKDKSNGQGIRKTDKQTWEVNLSYTLSRYTG